MSGTGTPKMIVTDLDGTLLNAQGAVSERNAAALRRAQADGVLVAVATGRPAWWLHPLIDCGYQGKAICLNGALVCDVGTGEVLSTVPLLPDTMRKFLAGLDSQIAGYAVAVERVGVEHPASFAEDRYDHPWAEEEFLAKEGGRFRITDREHLLSEPAMKLMVRYGHDSDALARIARDAGAEDVSVTFSSDDGLIEVAAAGVNKGVAVAKLAADNGIDAADVVAFGDMPNDAEMLAWAGHSYAMGTAHDAAIAAAKHRAPDHDDDGVAQVVEKWFQR